ncbi:SDR family oxidoreductase [Aestuariivita sp.]|jgi:NAD(P)-dependent dehydrogenase (short-subunit alcohol dehydrogenase family)|uniref:SDR family NAD(P)-dependent oxidoreductase n=1 Tax=Aestuariivita sp. TaxID=1872407 RepID=UPI00216E442C|nr:SDR family oxidoreductase [Aestuariivita sp.]MCE8009104.1 SDR family oxidoreductase [Aestuariivita sp.]
MRRFDGKTILVAGGGSIGPGMGNGKAAALLYAREGGRVLVVDRALEAAEETVALITAEGGQAMACAGDMTDPAAIGRATGILRDWGGIDVMHFNIGTSLPGGVTETTPEDWTRVFDINLGAAFHLSRAVLPMMEEAGRGALVFISSVASIRSGLYSYASYEVSKAALDRMARSIAAQYAPKGIRANVVLPGPIDTPHVTAVVAPDADPKELAAKRAAMTPMGRQGTPWDVAQAAAFLASDEAGFITGVCLPVDGGLTL